MHATHAEREENMSIPLTNTVNSLVSFNNTYNNKPGDKGTVDLADVKNILDNDTDLKDGTKDKSNEVALYNWMTSHGLNSMSTDEIIGAASTNGPAGLHITA
jgi:hypothetical protein